MLQRAIEPELAPNATAVAREASARRDSMSELFFLIASNTPWQQQQVRGLFSVYSRLCLAHPDRIVDFDSFRVHFFPLSSNHHFPLGVVRKCFSTLFDPDEDGLVSFPDFVVGVSKCVHGQRRHKIRLVFDLFDTDGDGCWSGREASSFLRACMLFVKHLSVDSLEQVDMRDMLQEEQFGWWKDTMEQMQRQMENAARAEAATNPAASPAAASAASPSPTAALPATPSSTRLISFDSFRLWATRHLRVKPLLSRFDVLPTPSMERATIQRLWEEHDVLHLEDQWYAMSESWWRGWKAYSGFKEPGEEDTPAASPNATADAASISNGGGLTASAVGAAHPDAALNPYLISDTDTDSDREDHPSPGSPPSTAGSASPPGSPATPTKSANRKTSHLVHSPTGIQIQVDAAPASATSASAGAVAQAASATAAAAAPSSSSRRNSASSAGVSLHLAPHGAAAAAPHSAAGAATPAGSPFAPQLSPSPAPGTAAAATGRGPAPLPPRPLSIDVSDLASPHNPLLLRQPLVEHEDFILLHASVWSQLVEWYGVVAGGVDYPRQVIEVGKDGARTKRVELYPLCLRVQRVGKEAPKPIACLPQVPLEGACILFNSPSQFTVHHLELRMLRLFYPPAPAAPATAGADKSKQQAAASSSRDENLRMWLRDGNDWRCLTLDDMSKTLESLEIQSEDTLLVELERDPAVLLSSKEAKRAAALAASSGSSGHKWAMDRRVVPRSWSQFEVGDQLDARDKQDVWYHAVIKRITAGTAGATVAAATASPSAAASPNANGASSVLVDNGSTVWVNFLGWDEKWNEYIPCSSLCQCHGPCHCSGRLAPLGAQVRFKKPNAPSATSVAAANAVASSSPPLSPDVGHPSAQSAVLSKGLCGLTNLGNTCFMNSTLQCLSATPYFIPNFILNSKWKTDINKSNPLGHKGLVASEFAALMSELWSGTHRSIHPSRFKRIIADFAPQFDGYQQHDSHELLAFLLDGLHEDLNRVLKKVPTTTVESNGRPDAVVVAESWSTYKIRNQSIIVDLFMGQLKSTVVCPDAQCGKVSITFDPFRYLTVPLPFFAERLFIITFCPSSNERLVNFGIVLPADSGVGLLKERLAQLTGLSAQRLMICDVCKSKLYRVLMDNKKVATIRENDILVAYEISPDAFRGPGEPPNGAVATPTASSSSTSSNSSSSSSSGSHSSRSPSVHSSGAPLVLRSDMIYLQAIHKYLLLDPRSGQATMSARFGIPVCLTTTPQTPNRRVHAMIAAAIQRWTPASAAGKLPYTIRVVEHTCTRCGFCSESSNCGGCCLSDDDKPCGLDGGFALCILWESESVARQVKSSMDDSHIVDHASVKLKPRNSADPHAPPLQLSECLDLFSSKEILSKDDAWFCSRCKTHQQASKQLQIFHAPEILIIHLKRFLQINRIRREKQTSMVDFPLKGLDLTPWIPKHALDNEPQPVYDLFAISVRPHTHRLRANVGRGESAVSCESWSEARNGILTCFFVRCSFVCASQNHYGGMGGGHYTSFCLHAESKRWFHFDDSRVSEITTQQLKTPYAYMLMYKRRV